MIVRRHFFRRLFGSLLAVATAPTISLAETRKQRNKRRAEPTPSPSPASVETPVDKPAAEKADKAFLRLWKSTDIPALEVKFRMIPFGKSADEALSPVKFEAGNFHFSDYSEVPAGPYTAEISAPGAKMILLPLHLAAGGQSTVLIRTNGTILTAEWIDDSPGGSDGPYEFAVYNLLPASGDIQVDLGNLLSIHLVSAHSSARLSGMKRGMYSASASGTDDKGRSFRWDTDVDLRQHRKVAVLIYLDAYGRVRPRVSAT